MNFVSTEHVVHPKMIISFGLDVESGFTFSAIPSPRFHNEERITSAAGLYVFEAHKDSLVCSKCGCKANMWLAARQSEHDNRVALNLYRIEDDGRPNIFTRDHIIPKSMGGCDDLENMRVMCGDCNHGRGNDLTEDELDFILSHPHLIMWNRIQSGLDSMQRMICRYDFDRKGFERQLKAYVALSERLREKCATIEAYADLDTRLIEIHQLWFERGE